MIKAVFLVGRGIDVMNFWDGTSQKRRRVLGLNKSFNGFKATEALIYDRKNQTKKTFLFFLVENEKDIPKIQDFLKIKKKEAVTVISNQDREITEKIIGKTKKRYHYVSLYGWVFFLREAVREQIINEFISSFFEEVISEKLIAAIERSCLESIKKMKAGTKYFR